ncbi:MAG: protein-L-isoaspartate O-methyltransferase [Gammaproteobacteria bacterium]|nr:protein-L-isoaspartate O-methyltransferase [Gammaproteobacteria bacterium]MCY4218858.1 protein-L-isoaspartate O-methyltransferase [Gammaproteobacteria bacterium]MCY4274478.1 protein-L-isoaspartate O-methyltransferase [Gammaproteobacteria bacterium]
MIIQNAQTNMIGQQIRTWNVLDRTVLQAFEGIEREQFVPEPYLAFAYADMVIPIREGQNMLEPKVIARMIDALELAPDHTVLEVGTGTGYSAAVLSRLSQQVISLEINSELVEASRTNLAKANIDNVEIIETNCFDYCSHDSNNAGKFDRTLITGSVPELSPVFLPMVNETGRIVGIQGHTPTMQAVICYADGTIKSLFETEASRLDQVQESVHFAF